MPYFVSPVSASAVRLGTEVLPVLNRKEQADPALRAQALLSRMVHARQLYGSIRIPHAVAPIQIVADLRAGRVTCSVEVDAPREGRSTTRVNWLVRQLKGAPDTVRVEAFAINARGAGSAELLGNVREDPSCLVTDPKRELRSFSVALTAPMGVKRGRGKGTFIDSVLDLIDTFYADVVQHLKAWSASPPKMREPVLVQEQPLPPLVSTSLSSQDGPLDSETAVEPSEQEPSQPDSGEPSSEARP